MMTRRKIADSSIVGGRGLHNRAEVRSKLFPSRRSRRLSRRRVTIMFESDNNQQELRRVGRRPKRARRDESPADLEDEDNDNDHDDTARSQSQTPSEDSSSVDSSVHSQNDSQNDSHSESRCSRSGDNEHRRSRHSTSAASDSSITGRPKLVRGMRTRRSGLRDDPLGPFHNNTSSEADSLDSRSAAESDDTSQRTDDQSASNDAGDGTVAIEADDSSKVVCCDKCDMNHETSQCPFFVKDRERHPDAQSRSGKKVEISSLPGSVLYHARVVSQPGDGSCLFHSLSHGLNRTRFPVISSAYHAAHAATAPSSSSGSASSSSLSVSSSSSSSVPSCAAIIGTSSTTLSASTISTTASLHHVSYSSSYYSHTSAFSYTSAYGLRQDICRYIVDNQHSVHISDAPIRDWINWDSGLSVEAYVRNMERGSWGGGIEMACFSLMKHCNVHVYERTYIGDRRGFFRIGAFDYPLNPEIRPVIRVLYCGGIHYDALEVPES